MHIPSTEFIDLLPPPDEKNRLRILFSGCLIGALCGYDGSSYGNYPLLKELISHPHVKPVAFCPEHFSFGTPRALCDIHGGTGEDVLDGKARVLTETGEDWTDGMVRAAERMLLVARQEKVHLAILMDISAACGSQVIYNGSRTSTTPVYQKGAGVCAALLMRNGIPVCSQRDYYSLRQLMLKVGQPVDFSFPAIDHHKTKWYKSYFGSSSE